MWRAYIAQHKYRVVLDGITDNASTSEALKSIRKVAEYFNATGKYPYKNVDFSTENFRQMTAIL